MMKRGPGAFDSLLAGLRGVPTPGADWRSVIALSNHALLTPALCAALAASGGLTRLPADARQYLELMHALNRTRNLRLREQLFEAVAALNRRGITPHLVKGAVPLFLSPEDRLPSRMTSDLDIRVEPSDEAIARAALEDIGYAAVPGVRDLARSQDVGVVELAPCRRGPIEEWMVVELSGRAAVVPSVQTRAWHWIAHDLLKEGDYWRGRIDLRHLHDLAELSLNDGVDWTALRAAITSRRARNALDTQLLALQQLFGCETISDTTANFVVRLHHWRRVFSARRPLAGAPLRLVGNLAWGAWRLSSARDLRQRGTLDLANRACRTLLGRDLRAKI
jgi:hypothetical protein